MPEQAITCPHCHREIPLSEVITHQIRESLRGEFEAVARQKEAALAQREDAIAKQLHDLTLRKKELEDEVAAKVDQEKKRLSAEAKKKAVEEIAVELQDLRAQVSDKDRRIQEAQAAELQLRQRQRELAEKQQAFELDMARKMDQERDAIRKDVLAKAAEESLLKEKEKEKQISDLREQIEVLKRKADQGSQQAQGEILELELESDLQARFPTDLIEPVPKGIKGADILQRVRDAAGRDCGTIVWESKRTKAWSDGWIQKLKEDQREVKADVAAIVSVTLPAGVTDFAQVQGVWVSSFRAFVALATVLRAHLVQMASLRLAETGKSEKMEAMYGYLSGNRFKHRVEGVVEAFMAMQKDLAAEKRAMEAVWAKREHQLEQAARNMAGMYGDVKGLLGGHIEIRGLELESPEDAEKVIHIEHEKTEDTPKRHKK
jgi:hypothetical protein